MILKNKPHWSARPFCMLLLTVALQILIYIITATTRQYQFGAVDDYQLIVLSDVIINVLSIAAPSGIALLFYWFMRRRMAAEIALPTHCYSASCSRCWRAVLAE